MQWVRATDAARYPMMHRTAPTTKNDPVQGFSSAEGEKPCSTEPVLVEVIDELTAKSCGLCGAPPFCLTFIMTPLTNSYFFNLFLPKVFKGLPSSFPTSLFPARQVSQIMEAPEVPSFRMTQGSGSVCMPGTRVSPLLYRRGPGQAGAPL